MKTYINADLNLLSNPKHELFLDVSGRNSQHTLPCKNIFYKKVYCFVKLSPSIWPMIVCLARNVPPINFSVTLFHNKINVEYIF